MMHTWADYLDKLKSGTDVILNTASWLAENVSITLP